MTKIEKFCLHCLLGNLFAKYAKRATFRFYEVFMARLRDAGSKVSIITRLFRNQQIISK